MATPAQPAQLPTIEDVVSIAREYVNATDGKRYSHAQHALTRLGDVIRALPAWLQPPIVEPAAEIERTLACGVKYRIANEDGNLVMVVNDGVDAMAPAMTREEGVQLRADLARVLAAIGGGQ